MMEMGAFCKSQTAPEQIPLAGGLDRIQRRTFRALREKRKLCAGSATGLTLLVCWFQPKLGFHQAAEFCLLKMGFCSDSTVFASVR